MHNWKIPCLVEPIWNLKKALAAIMIIIGLYFLLAGVYFKKFNSIMINCAILGLILFSFLNLFTKVNLALCMLLGVAIAFAAMEFEAFNGAILGIVVGYLFGSLSYNILIGVITVNPQALYWSTLIGCMVLVSLAGTFMKDYMVCLAASLVGAYAFVRGISISAGGYPDETYVMMLINHGEYSQFGRVFGSKVYAYIGGIFALTAIGYLIQSFCVPKNPENDKPKDGDDKKEDKKEEEQPLTSEKKDDNEKKDEKKDEPIKSTVADTQIVKESLPVEDGKKEDIQN